ncbi:MAG: HAMP domain-containing sensor histidine kinase [Oligoflexia bacterium]|nr:HAMP domain-containing sensor histidine kinase [Oligoflexia bacterium]
MIILVLVLLIGSLISDFAWGVPSALILGDFLILAACLTAALAQRHWYFWSVSYGLVWVATLLSLGSSGGVNSPFFGPELILLMLSGACTLSRVSSVYIFGFTALNGLGWLALSAIGGSHLHALPPSFVVKQNCILTLGVTVCLTDFLGIWRKQKSFYEEQAKRYLETESRLIHADKMAEIGKLVATTAHELAQPAQVISMSAALLQGYINRGQTAEVNLRALSERLILASDRLSRLLRYFRNFSRKESCVVKTKTDLRDPLYAVSNLLEHDLRGRRVHFRMAMSPEPLWVTGDEHRLQQVFLNLINNARDAALTAERPLISVRCELLSGWVRVQICNNGRGIPLDVQQRLFEPYFTTKPSGEGTGLGLSICEQLIGEHNGRIMFSSSPDETLFVVDIPREQGLAAEMPGLRSSVTAASEIVPRPLVS